MLDALKSLLRQTPLAPVIRRVRDFWHGGPDVARRRNALYDRQTIEVMQRVLSRASSAVDIGAHKGSILEHLVRLAPAGRHFAFEPIPDLAASLRARFPGVAIFQCALSDKAGPASFELVTNALAYSGLRPTHYYGIANPQIHHINVETNTLDKLIPREVQVSFVKIDVEGGEYHAMLGGLSTLKRCRPTIVFEASAITTGMYGVSAEDLYRLITIGT